MKHPDFFIVGAPKCGTTFLHSHLKNHPEIFMPDRKELHYFGTDLYHPDFVRDKTLYLSFFQKVKNEKRAGEASVWYLYSKRAAYEIKEFSPSAQIIIMLRNPVDMLYSLHSQYLFNGCEDITDFEEALRKEDERKKGLFLPKNAYPVEGLFYRETAKYTQQVKRYFEIFDKNAVHIIIFDDLKNDPQMSLRDTFRFLGVDENIRDDIKLVNPNKRARSIFLRNVLQNPPPFLLNMSRKLIPHPVRSLMRKSMWNLNIRHEARIPMKPELRKILQEEFKPEIKQLSDLLGRDLTYWCSN
ncbi:MAG: sulfotransferase domain-containing protein [Planctomycetes bacterium]|nr:sulfotransferase domain-containing protein [Planctomycetota bacterium]